MRLSERYSEFKFLPDGVTTNGKVCIKRMQWNKYYVYKSQMPWSGFVVMKNCKIRGFRTVVTALDFARKLTKEKLYDEYRESQKIAK